MANYFNSLPLTIRTIRRVCEFMDQSEFADGIKALKGKK
jgi:ketol-acid reductoisomerase